MPYNRLFINIEHNTYANMRVKLKSHKYHSHNLYIASYSTCSFTITYTNMDTALIMTVCAAPNMKPVYFDP